MEGLMIEGPIEGKTLNIYARCIQQEGTVGTLFKCVKVKVFTKDLKNIPLPKSIEEGDIFELIVAVE